jgi:hypothetical protein
VARIIEHGLLTGGEYGALCALSGESILGDEEEALAPRMHLPPAALALPHLPKVRYGVSSSPALF